MIECHVLLRSFVELVNRLDKARQIKLITFIQPLPMHAPRRGNINHILADSLHYCPKTSKNDVEIGINKPTWNRK